MLDFRIETFLCVCRHMNFTHAANELHITQPAVTQHIQFLEKEYCMKLFEKKGKLLILTEGGKMLLTSSTTMHRDTIYLMKQFKEGLSHDIKLNFGATLTAGQFIIPKKLAAFAAKTPDLTVHMTVENTKLLCRYLDEGSIDFAVVEGNFPKDQYDFRLLKKEAFLPVCAGSHEFIKEPVYLSDLINETLIIREKNSGGRDILERSLDSCNLVLGDFKHYMEINNIQAIKTLVSSDCGIAFLYESAVKAEIENGSLLTFSLDDFSVLHDIHFIWRKNSAFSDLYQSVFEALISC